MSDLLFHVTISEFIAFMMIQDLSSETTRLGGQSKSGDTPCHFPEETEVACQENINKSEIWRKKPTFHQFYNDKNLLIPPLGSQHLLYKCSFIYG